MSEGESKTQQAAPGPQAPVFEDNLKRLEDIVARLEEGNLALDQSLKLYEEGLNAYKQCHQMLKDAEGKIRKLVETLEGELKEEPFELTDQQ